MKNYTLGQYLTAEDLDVFEMVRENIDPYHTYICENFGFYEPRENPKLLLMAHVDTLRTPTTKPKLIRHGSYIWNAKGVLGADDRAGVYAITRILPKLDIPTAVLLTNFEEIGGWGARDFIAHEPDLDSVNMIVQFDRRGTGSYVSYLPLPEDVENILNTHCFMEEYGSWSDVKTVSEYAEIPHVNLSTGFYSEHTVKERLFIPGMMATIKACRTMLPALAKTKREYIEEPLVSNWNWENNWNGSWKNSPLTSSNYLDDFTFEDRNGNVVNG